MLIVLHIVLGHMPGFLIFITMLCYGLSEQMVSCISDISWNL